MTKEQLAKVIDETADKWMGEFHAIVGGRFDRNRWTGSCAKWFKDAILPLFDEKKETTIGNPDSPKTHKFGSKKTR